MTQSLVGWCASVVALLGAALVAMRSPVWSKWGFVAFLASNLLWISWGVHHGVWELVIQNVGFFVTSVSGILTWFGLLPRLRGHRVVTLSCRLHRRWLVSWQTYRIRNSRVLRQRLRPARAVR